MREAAELAFEIISGEPYNAEAAHLLGLLSAVVELKATVELKVVELKVTRTNATKLARKSAPRRAL